LRSRMISPATKDGGSQSGMTLPFSRKWPTSCSVLSLVPATGTRGRFGWSSCSRRRRLLRRL
jgi:hypothetical protein